MILYCASGQRAPPTRRARCSEDLGYEHVRSMTGGITLWKDRGYEVEVPRALSAEQRERYSRHLLIPEIGAEGQQKLLDAKVLLLGAGGLGSPTALYLAAAGVGTLGIVDDDVVDLSNLQRQVIHNSQRIGTPKVDSAEESIHALNPDVKVVKYKTRLDASNIMEIIDGYDVVVDGVDNFPTRYLLNDASVRLRIPVVSASILGFDGQLSVFKPYDGPVLPLPVPRAAAGRARAVVRRQRRARRAARHDGPAAGDRGRQADPRHRRARDRAPAAVRRARRDAHRGEGAPRPRLPDLLARARRRSPTRRWASSRTTRRSAPQPASLRSDDGDGQDPAGAARLGGRREGGRRRRRQRRRGAARSRHAATPPRRASCSPPRASSTATSTCTSTTRTCACSTASTPPSARATRS